MNARKARPSGAGLPHPTGNVPHQPGHVPRSGCRHPAVAGQKLNVEPTLNIRPCMIRVGASQEGPKVVVHDSVASVLKKL